MTSQENTFLQTIVSAIRQAPMEIVHDICERLEHLSNNYFSEHINKIIQSITQPEVRRSISQLFHVWKNNFPNLSPISVSWALKASAVTDEMNRSEQKIELVWTGPHTSNSPYRQTYQVFMDLICSAKYSMLIVTFVAYDIPEIAEALLKAATRGVKIKFIFESPQESEGKVTLNAFKAIGLELARISEVYVWPLDKRMNTLNGKHGSLHAKCVIVDDAKALISSANLTSYAMDMNMEIGLLFNGGDIPQQISNHFKKLIEMDCLVKISLDNGRI